MERHDGFYNCSIENDFQVRYYKTLYYLKLYNKKIFQLFNVTILTAPVFTQPLKSVVSSVAVSLVLNCSVSGHPMPTISW